MDNKSYKNAVELLNKKKQQASTNLNATYQDLIQKRKLEILKDQNLIKMLNEIQNEINKAYESIQGKINSLKNNEAISYSDLKHYIVDPLKEIYKDQEVALLTVIAKCNFKDNKIQKLVSERNDERLHIRDKYKSEINVLKDFETFEEAEEHINILKFSKKD